MSGAEFVTYFTGEKHGAMLLLGMALFSLAGAGLFWHSRGAFVAMVWPLLVLGLFELLVGSVIVLRTPNQVQALERGLREAKAVTVSTELDRMTTVDRNFRIVKVAEVLLISAGLLAVWIMKPGNAWYAVGLGLVLQGSALLAFDAFAHHRAEVYMQWLQSL